MTLSNLIDQLGVLSWHEPRWLLLATLPVVIHGLRARLKNRQTQYADAHLLPWVVANPQANIQRRLFSKNSAYLLGWLLLGIAMSGPRLPLQHLTLAQPTNLDIMLVVDVSRSMQATDIRPSRLQRAQIEIEELLARTRGNRIGIIVYAARPHLLTPLTADMSALRFYLQSLDTLALPTMGSEPAAALQLAQDTLRNSTNPAAIILLSDGDFPTAITSARTTGATAPLFVLGIGSQEGAAIPLQTGQWLEHNGQPVISRLNEAALRTLAGKSSNNGIGGQYSRATDDDTDWQQLYDDGIARLATRPAGDDAEHKILWRQLYHWPLLIAILLLWIALTPYEFSTRTRLASQKATHKDGHTPIHSSTIIPPARSLLVISGVLLLTFYPHQPADAADVSEAQAYRNYENKDYSAAISIYKKLTGFNARFGEAASHYKAANYHGAIRQFSSAVLAAHDDQQRATALFNLGNSYFQTGNYAAAVTTYADALKYRPNHKNAEHNLQFSRALKKAVDARAKQTRQRFARMGSGPQRAATDEVNVDNQAISLSIDEDATPENTVPLPELADLSSKTLEQLIQKGLSQIQLAASSHQTKNNASYQRDQLAFINARLRMAELEDQQALLWKRLFEMEEGFPAPLAEPRPVPGVPAW